MEARQEERTMVRGFSRPFLPPIAFRAKTNSLVPRTGRGGGKARWHAPFEEVLDGARRGAGLKTGPRLLNGGQGGLQEGEFLGGSGGWPERVCTGSLERELFSGTVERVCTGSLERESVVLGELSEE